MAIFKDLLPENLMALEFRRNSQFSIYWLYLPCFDGPERVCDAEQSICLQTLKWISRWLCWRPYSGRHGVSTLEAGCAAVPTLEVTFAVLYCAWWYWGRSIALQSLQLRISRHTPLFEVQPIGSRPVKVLVGLSFLMRGWGWTHAALKSNLASICFWTWMRVLPLRYNRHASSRMPSHDFVIISLDSTNRRCDFYLRDHKSLIEAVNKAVEMRKEEDCAGFSRCASYV